MSPIKGVLWIRWVLLTGGWKNPIARFAGPTVVYIHPMVALVLSRSETSTRPGWEKHLIDRSILGIGRGKGMNSGGAANTHADLSKTAAPRTPIFA